MRGDNHPPSSPIATASKGWASTARGRSCAWATLRLVGVSTDSLGPTSSCVSWRVSGGVSTMENLPREGSCSLRLQRRQNNPRHLHQSHHYSPPPLSPRSDAVTSGAWMSRSVPRSPPSRARGPVLAVFGTLGWASALRWSYSVPPFSGKTDSLSRPELYGILPVRSLVTFWGIRMVMKILFDTIDYTILMPGKVLLS